MRNKQPKDIDKVNYFLDKMLNESSKIEIMK